MSGGSTTITNEATNTTRRQPAWMIAGRIFAGAGVLLALAYATIGLWFANCHDGGGFCADEKTSEDAWGYFFYAAICVAIAGVLAMVALAVPRRRWATGGVIVLAASLLAGVIAYSA